ncbi:hypothetical protein [Kribbella sp. NBC_00359]|uniref:hypothetical protein n=1 Tax=Kribbella sp. NBC_00359 TaxID=2975966 RepID=UPI002E225AA6
MFITPQSIKAETAYKHERTKRQFRTTSRRARAAQAERPEPGHARRADRYTTAA